ncbi:PH domain-containing protein [Psychrobacillus sp. L4]|uniref:PH domain-containing protein n=1 Tax=Psychrobacillus sp. L4 TaxID=3236892 RepID=UPI0036F40DED
MMFNEKYKLHPISAIINFIKVLKDMILPFIVVVTVNGFGGSRDSDGWPSFITYSIYAVVLIFLLVSGIVKWKRFRYWFEEGELRIEYGLFVKKMRYIPFERIQSLNYTEGIFHRPFGLVKVKVETAGGGPTKEADAVLTAITKDAAEQIKREMIQTKSKQSVELNEAIQHEVVLTEEARPIFTMSIKDLIVLASTSGGVGVFFSGLAVFAAQFSNIIPYEMIYDEIVVFIRFGALIIVLGVFFVLLVAWVVSVILTLINFYNFTISIEDNEIVITRGLLEKKKITLPLSRIQGVRVVENPFRQLIGYASIIVDSAGGSLEEKDERIRLLPLVKKTKIHCVLEQIFLDLDLEPNFIPVPKRSRKFFYRLDFLWIIPVSASVIYFFYPFGLLSLILLPLSYIFGMWQHRTAGYAVNGLHLVMRYRNLSKVTIWMEKKRIQSMTERMTFFQKRKNVSSIITTIKSGVGGSTAIVPHLDKADAERLINWYQPTKSNTVQKEKEQPIV